MSGFWIIGFRAAGKTTMGRALAERLGYAFLDADEEWEKIHGALGAFVESHGLEAFRRGEAEVLAACARRLEAGEKLVVATGGGFVDWAPSREIVAQSACPKLYLDLPAELLWERLEREPDRKKIGDLSSLAALEHLLEKRRPFYEKIASLRRKDQDINACLAALKSHLGPN